MPLFRYHAFSDNNAEHPPLHGWLRAKNRPEAKSKLRAKGMRVVSLRKMSWETIAVRYSPRNPPPRTPLLREPNVASRAKPEYRFAPSRKTILIQHGYPEVQHLYHEFFKQMGFYNIALADDHARAIELARTIHFDLVVLDIVSMGWQWGHEATKTIRGVYRGRGGTPILGISTWGERAEKLFLDAGANAFLTAPCRFDELVQTVADLLPDWPCGRPTVT